MINRLLIILFLITFSSNMASAQFKATLTAEGSDLIVTLTPFGGDITTDFSQIEFFIRTDYTLMDGFVMSAPAVNTDNFPGSIPLGITSDVTSGGYRTFELGYPQTGSGSTNTYTNGLAYELARMTLTLGPTGIPNAAVFELVSDLTSFDSHLTITSDAGYSGGAGSDLSFSSCIYITGTCPAESVFYGDVLSGSGFATSTEATFLPVPLPVELSNFIGWNEGKMNKLKWGTQSEENSSHFEIQKSANGEDFERIGTVYAAGNSASAIDYNFDDTNPFLGENYYRLKVIDLDGSYEYSKVILIKTSGESVIKGYPNPFTSTVSFELSSPISGMVQISLYDITGKQVLSLEREIESGLSTQNLELDHLTEGTYIAKVLLPGSNEFLSTKIIKNNK